MKLLGQNFVKYFVCFLGNGTSRKNVFAIYWPLVECIKFRLKSQPKVRYDFLNWFVTSVWLHNTSLSNSENEKKNIESKKFKTPWTKQQKNFLARWFAFGFMDFHRFCCLLANLEVKLYLKLHLHFYESLYIYNFLSLYTAFKCCIKLRISLWTSVWKSFNDQEINCLQQPTTV